MKNYHLVLIMLLAIVLIIPGGSTLAASVEGDFTDVKTDFWASEEIYYLQNYDIIRGYPDGTFKPNNSVTRAQTAIMLKRALNLSTAYRPDPGFSDISKDYFAYSEIAAVVDEGLMKKGDIFRPGEYLTRAEMAEILVKAFNLKGSYTGEIKDVSAELKPFVETLAGNGVTVIYPDHTFKPEDTIKRGTFSVFMARVKNPSYRSDYAVLPLLFPGMKFNMTVAEAKNIMNAYELRSEVELPFDTVDYQISYNSHITGLDGEEVVYLTFKNDQLFAVMIDVEYFHEEKPTDSMIDEGYERFTDFFRPFTGDLTPDKEPFTPDSFKFYEKEGYYSGNFQEIIKVHAGGYDFTTDGMDYYSSYTFVLKGK